MPVRRLPCSRPESDDGSETVTSLAAGLDAVASARELVAVQAASLPVPQRGDAVLLVSELVTNAVLHGTAPITLTLSAAPGRIRVEVHDHGAALPVQRPDHERLTTSGGLGLALVEALASGWGVSRTAGREGKGVWFEMRVRAPRP